MANTPDDRRRFKLVFNRIYERYHEWIADNRHFKRVFAASDKEFDEIIQFLGPIDFQIFLMQKNFKTGDGCSVAAATLSSRDDDTNLAKQRQIIFNRAMVTEHTLTHELFHFLCHPAFSRAVATKVNEGFTEYFTHKIIGAPASAAAKAAAVDDAGVEHVSGYSDYTKAVGNARTFLKTMIFPMMMEDQNPALAAMQAGGRRAVAFQPSQVQMLDVKNFTKRAYFKGEAQMIQFIKDQAVW